MNIPHPLTPPRAYEIAQVEINDFNILLADYETSIATHIADLNLMWSPALRDDFEPRANISRNLAHLHVFQAVITEFRQQPSALLQYRLNELRINQRNRNYHPPVQDLYDANQDLFSPIYSHRVYRNWFHHVLQPGAESDFVPTNHIFELWHQQVAAAAAAYPQTQSWPLTMLAPSADLAKPFPDTEAIGLNVAGWHQHVLQPQNGADYLALTMARQQAVHDVCRTGALHYPP